MCDAAGWFGGLGELLGKSDDGDGTGGIADKSHFNDAGEHERRGGADDVGDGRPVRAELHDHLRMGCAG